VGLGELTLRLSFEPNDIAVLKIYSPVGHLLRQQPLSSKAYQLNVGNLELGIYLVQVSDGKEVWQERCVVKHP
jgi:hypothetical protein